jgi:hypothetical protein
MKIFISWSGEYSGAIAKELRVWLGKMFSRGCLPETSIPGRAGLTKSQTATGHKIRNRLCNL